LVLLSVSAALAAAPAPPGGERRERGSLVIEGIPEIPPRVIDRLIQYQNTRSALVFDWTADGAAILIGTRFGETVQVHRVERPGGDRAQVTFYPEPIGSASANPDPKTRGFLFVKDVGGGENFQFYYHDFESGTDALLTDGQSRNTGPRWSHRGDRFAYSSTRRNGRDHDLYVADRARPEEARRVLEREGAWSVLDWSTDDRRLLVQREVSVSESYLHELDLATGALTQVNPKPGTIAYEEAVYARRGRGLYLTSDEGSEFLRLRHLDLDSGRFTDLTAAIPWDVEEIELSPAGDRLAFTVNEHGYGRLYLMETATSKPVAVAGIPAGIVDRLRFDPEGERLAFSLGSASAPADAYVLDLADRAPDRKAGRLTRWTTSEVGGLNPDTFIAPERVEFPTFDRKDGAPRRIPAFYFKPRKGTGPHPVLITIHGGPEAQYRPSFSATLQYFVNELGLAVLAPNVRGSSGYGKTYLTLDNGVKREDSVKDIGALLDWIGTRPELDASRVVVQGGSYGGYMVLATMTHYSDRLRAGIDTVGISNFVTFLKNTSGYRQDLRRVEYGDERDPKMLEFLGQISPLNRVDRIRKPLFIIQGQNDPRVPLSESEQMLAAIKQNGVPAWYLMAKDEGHGFRKKANQDYSSSAIVLFLETHVLGGPAGDGATTGS
jgi:dipeptidyl aminopeptidase/acylaminoacyl peptidase